MTRWEVVRVYVELISLADLVGYVMRIDIGKCVVCCVRQYTELLGYVSLSVCRTARVLSTGHILLFITPSK